MGRYIKVLKVPLALVSMVVALALMVLPKAFADSDYFGYTATTGLKESASSQEITVSLIAAKAMNVYSIGGDFMKYEADDNDRYFTLTSMENSSKFATGAQSDIGNSVGRFSWESPNGETTPSFAAGDVIWSGTYTVAANAPAGHYNIPIVNLQLVLANNAGEIEGVQVFTDIEISELSSQGISYATGTETKKYGDAAFTKQLTVDNATTPGAITYTSSNENVARVNKNTGEVTIVGVGGPVRITATAAAAEGYKQTSVYYDLTVNKKPITISEVTVSDKTYDGTTAAFVSTAVLSDPSLTLSGNDFTVVADFADANVGNNKNVVAAVTLSAANAALYELRNNTYTISGRTISPFGLSASNVILVRPTTGFIYSGSAIMPDAVVSAKLDGVHETVLKKDVDYTVTYPTGLDAINVGDKNVIIRAIGNFTDGGAIEKPYTIDKYAIQNSDISLVYNAVRYDGNAKEPGVTLYIGTFAVDPDDYTVEYANNTGITDHATVTVKAKSNTNISGTATATFAIIDKEVLSISGISNQEVTYTGLPVKLAGTLTVGPNTDNITVDKLSTTWYASNSTTPIAQPTNVGSYRVKYAYDGENYAGSLEVTFDIVRATSPTPAEMTADFRIEAGETLGNIGGTRTNGFVWKDATSAVSTGNHTYAATYTYKGDTANYTTLLLNVPVYGLTRIGVVATVDGDGGAVHAPSSALEGDDVDVEFIPEDGYEVEKVLLNTVDVTNAVKNNLLSVTADTSDLDLVVSFRKVYTVTNGDGEKYTVGDGNVASFRIDADLELFTAGGKVYVDGQLVDEKYYKVASGSTIITLTDEYIATLGSGDHLIAVVFSDGGIARATFNVTNPKKDAIDAPDTGAFTANASVKVAGFGAIVVVFGIVGIVLKKKFTRSKIDFDKK